MPYEIYPSPRDSIVVCKLVEELTYPDMMIVEPLGLDRGPRYILLDASEISVALPEHFLEGARQSFFTHDNMQHLALYVKSQLLGMTGIMVAKVTRRPDKLSVHKTFDDAMNHLLKLTDGG
jgi:hypothetical protein